MNRPTIQHWYEYVRVRNVAHTISANIWDRWNSAVGFLAILSGVIAGYEVTQKKAGDLDWWVIGLGLFAILAAVGNAAMKFFGFENRKQRHVTTASLYAALQYEMESLLMDTASDVSPDVYRKISNNLTEINKQAPLLSDRVFKRARIQISEQSTNEIPEHFRYDMTLTEDWRLENGKYVEIKNPVRTYDCEPADLYEFRSSRKVSFQERHLMTREGEEIPTEMEGDGIMEGDVAFIRYCVRGVSTRDSTYGTIVLKFTNRVEASGYWMTASVKGAEFLVGKIGLKLRTGDSPVSEEASGACGR